MNKGISRSGYARRIDLKFRARFPNLQTQIYEVTKNCFQIVFSDSEQNAESLSEEFNSSICFATENVTLSNKPPKTYIRMISKIPDTHSMSQMNGLPLRKIDLINLISSKFAAIEILDVEVDPGMGSATILLGEKISESDGSKLFQFLSQLELPLSFSTYVSPDKKPDISLALNDPMFILASALRPRSPSYVRADEEFWFENIDQIASSNFALDRFPGIGGDPFRCYLDLTLGEMHINLRQALLLYDEVWCSLPLHDSHDAFLSQQGLTEDDLLVAVGSGRLKIVTTQPEERLRLPFLDRLFERCPTAILGRRTTAALLMADLAHTAEVSFLNERMVADAIQQLAHMLSELEGIPSRKLLSGFLWPLMSRRDCLQGLLDRGSKAGPALGLADALSTQLQAKFGLDLSLETKMFSESVHIAHALNATLFGPLNEPQYFTHLKFWIGRHLNFHSNFNERNHSMWRENEERDASGQNTLPSVQLFEFDKRVPIQEILEDSALGSDRLRGRGLYRRLAELPLEERHCEVERLNGLLRKLSRKERNGEIALDITDVGISAAEFLMALFAPPVSTIRRLSKPMIEKARRNRSVDTVIMKLEDKMLNTSDAKDLHFLSRVSRVASFRVDRV